MIDIKSVDKCFYTARTRREQIILLVLLSGKRG